MQVSLVIILSLSHLCVLGGSGREVAVNFFQFTSLWIKRNHTRGDPENHTQEASSSLEYDFTMVSFTTSQSLMPQWYETLGGRGEPILHGNRKSIIGARRQCVLIEKDGRGIRRLFSSWGRLFYHILNLGSPCILPWPTKCGRNDVGVQGLCLCPCGSLPETDMLWKTGRQKPCRLSWAHSLSWPLTKTHSCEFKQDPKKNHPANHRKLTLCEKW